MLFIVLINPVTYLPDIFLLHTNHIWQCFVSPTHVHAVACQGTSHKVISPTLVFLDREPSEINTFLQFSAISLVATLCQIRVTCFLCMNK